MTIQEEAKSLHNLGYPKRFIASAWDEWNDVWKDNGEYETFTEWFLVECTGEANQNVS